MRHYYTLQQSARQSIASFRNELRRQKKRAREVAVLDNHVQYAAQALKEAYGPDPLINYNAIRALVAARLPVLLRSSVSRATVAVHECGHFVAFEHEGMLAGTTTIRGAAFDKGGWHGRALHYGDVYLGSRRWMPDPGVVSGFARVTAAGPIAEELLGGGCALHNPGELLNARAYSDRAAELLHVAPSDFWRRIVLLAVALVECHSEPILKLAAMLEKRKEITRFSPSVRKVLATIDPKKIVGHTLSDEGRAVAEQIIRSTPKTTAFIIKGSDK